jgi:Asp-tRNA(Asn)/Glu-tRNA(Gln) amidotransferase B subunit
MEFNEIKIFGDKTLSDLFQEIYKNQNYIHSQIDEAINELKELVNGVSDATILSPIIKDYLDTTVKNNDILVKMAAIIERSISRQASVNPEITSFDFSPEELDELRSQVEQDKFKSVI